MKNQNINLQINKSKYLNNLIIIKILSNKKIKNKTNQLYFNKNLV